MEACRSHNLPHDAAGFESPHSHRQRRDAGHGIAPAPSRLPTVRGTRARRRGRNGTSLHGSAGEGSRAPGRLDPSIQFPYMERGDRRPDSPPLCHATVRAATAAARERLPQLRLIAGGKSFGGRMTSQAQAKMPLPGVCGLVFFGFPLHPAGKPSTDRAAHLPQISVPMLFVQGTRDTLADHSLLRPLVESLPLATLEAIEGADHSFHVPVRTGRTDAQVRAAMVETFLAWSAKTKV